MNYYKNKTAEGLSLAAIAAQIALALIFLIGRYEEGGQGAVDSMWQWGTVLSYGLNTLVLIALSIALFRKPHHWKWPITGFGAYMLVRSDIFSALAGIFLVMAGLMIDNQQEHKTV